jgi:hypothetical protein
VSQITIEPGNPNDFRDGALEEIAFIIESIEPGPIRIHSREQRGYGVTWWEVLYIWLPYALMAGGTYVGTKAGDKIVDALTDDLIEWAKRKFKKDGESRRPKYIAILGPDGETVKSVLVEKSKEEGQILITDKTDEDKKKERRRQLPPA